MFGSFRRLLLDLLFQGSGPETASVVLLSGFTARVCCFKCVLCRFRV